MLGKLKQRFSDMQTITSLCQAAEKHAHADSEKEPGAEHFILAALELPDGTARQAFQRIHADPAQFHNAITQQYHDALHDAGIGFSSNNSPLDHPVNLASNPGVYRTKASGRALMQKLTTIKKETPGKPLLSAHIVLAALSAQYGVALRALRRMGIEPSMLMAAVQAEINQA
mgnify:CR=1 FL=1